MCTCLCFTFYSGSYFQESRVQIECTEECTSESGSYRESGSDVYVPTPDRDRVGKVSPVDLPNRLCWASF